MAFNQALLLPPTRKTNLYPDLWLDPALNVTGAGVSAARVAVADSYGGVSLSGTAGMTWAANFVADVPAVLAGKLTKSLNLNGSSEYLRSLESIATFSNMAELTLSIWLKPTNVTALQTMLFLGTVFNLRVRATSGRYSMVFGTDNSAFLEYLYPTEFATAGAWSHLAVTYKTAQLRMYADGTLTSAGTITSVTGDVLNGGTERLYVGVTSVPNYYYTGLLCDARIYHSALADTDIAILAAGNEPATLPIHRWRMDDAVPAATLLGDTVASWEGRDGSNTIVAQGTAAAQPCVIPSNNRAAKIVSFDGADEVVSDSELVVTGKTGRVAVPVKTVWSGTARVVYSQSLASAADTYLKLGVSATGQMWYKYNLEGTADELTGSTILGTGWHVLEWVSDGATISMFVDGVAETITVVGGDNSGKWFGHLTTDYRSVVGAVITSGGTASFMRGTMGQLVAARRDMTAAEVALMRARLSQCIPVLPALPVPATYSLSDACDDDAGWTAATGTLTESTDYFRRGAKSLKLTGDTTAVVAWKPAALAEVDTSNEQYNLRARFYVTDKGDGTPSVKSVRVYITQDATKNLFVNVTTPDVGWNVIDIPIFAYTVGNGWGITGAFTGPITGIGFGGTTQNATGAVYLDEVLIHRNEGITAKVVWTFDDFNALAVTTMATIIEGHGWHAAFAAIAGNMTAENWSVAHDLEARGHMVCGHGYAHTSWDTPITAAAAEADVRAMIKAFHANGCTKGSRVFIAPFGAWGLTAGHRDVIELYTDCALGVNTKKDLEQSTWASDAASRLWNPNPPTSRRTLSRGMLGDKGLTTTNVDRLIAAKGFCPIMQHNLDNGTNYLTEAQFITICDYIATKEAAGLLEVSSLYEEVYG